MWRCGVEVGEQSSGGRHGVANGCCASILYGGGFPDLVGCYARRLTLRGAETTKRLCQTLTRQPPG